MMEPVPRVCTFEWFLKKNNFKKEQFSNQTFPENSTLG